MALPIPLRRAAVVATLLLPASCGVGTGRPEPPPLVLVVSFDTFRADLLDGRRADGSPELPHLARFADRALRFDDCYAPIAFTPASHMTMVTGRHPLSHGVIDEKSSTTRTGPTLAETMRAAGYRTEAVVNSHWLRDGSGFERGFDRHQMVDDHPGSAGRVTELALEAVDLASAAGSRLFLFVHYFEAHSDFLYLGNRLTYYSPPEDRADLELAAAGFCTPDGRCATKYLLAADRGEVTLDATEIELHRELYRRGARFLDRHVGDLLDGLHRRGRLDPALVVITADHGEEFREHGRLLHKQLWTESLRVLLLIRLPRGARGGERSGALSELSDLMPTVLARVGLPRPDGLQGRDLLAEAPGAEPEVLALDRADSTRAGLRTRDWLLVHSRKSGSTQLFDRRADSGEQRDLAPEQPEQARRLLRRLSEISARFEAARRATEKSATAPVDEATSERLRSLGYL